MLDFQETFIPAKGVRSLCWHGEQLVDWVAGGISYSMDGSATQRRVHYALNFDSARMSPSGKFEVIYTRLGTKGLLLCNGEIMRELNRSFYFANIYEYPIALFQLPDGREVIAHCPDEFNIIEIEEIESGKRLTTRKAEKSSAPFHSRLAANQSGSRLLSTGWIWQPNDVIYQYNVGDVLADPSVLDLFVLSQYGSCSEVGNAAFLDDDLLVLSSAIRAEDFGWDYPEPRLSPGRVAVYDLEKGTFISAEHVEEEVGTMMPVGADHIIGFYDHPKLIQLKTGSIVHRWPNVKSGKQLSSIIGQEGLPPPIATDTKNRQFAVAGEEGITIVRLYEEG